MNRLKLLALDEDDLAVVSAHVQDAVGHARALTFERRAATFTAALNRYVWERDPAVTGERRTPERRRAILRFARVRAVRSQGFEPGGDQTLSLLALRFEPGGESEGAQAEDAGPEGTVEMVFSGGAALRLDVECIEAQLIDTDAAWAAGNRPEHDEDDVAGAPAVAATDAPAGAETG